jgi:formate/nitrite transporter
VAENWLVVILGNLAGALFFSWLMAETRLWESPAVGENVISIAAAKCRLPFWVALVRGILCNWLVCLAVLMATAARDIPGKLLACYVPIMTFVASGFEHSVANMYFIPVGLMVSGHLGRSEPGLTWEAFLVNNLIPVTIGNILGGVIFVASAYWFVHLWQQGANER